MEATTRPSYPNDDYSRYAGPAYVFPTGLKRKENQLFEEACEALLNDPLIDTNDIDIEVSDGVITLKGRVADVLTIDRAIQCVEQLPDVDVVINQLSLKEFHEEGSQGLIKNQTDPEEGRL